MRRVAGLCVALVLGGCADVFGLDPVELGTSSAGTASSSATSATSSTSTATTTTTGGDGGAGGTGGAEGGGGADGGAGGGCIVSDEGSPLAQGSFTDDLDGWTTPGFGPATCGGGCGVEAIDGGAHALSRAIVVTLEPAECLRFTLEAEGVGSAVARPFVVDASGDGFDAPDLELDAGEPQVRTSSCRLPAGFAAAEVGFAFTSGAGAPLIEGAELTLHAASVELLLECPDQAPRCVDRDGTSTWWDEQAEGGILAQTDFTRDGQDGWTDDQATWGECSGDGCTLSSPATVAGIGRSLGEVHFPAGSCLTLDVDASSTDPDGRVFVGVGSALGMTLHTPYVPLAPGASSTCSIPRDVSVDAALLAFVVEGGTEVTVRSASIGRAPACPCAEPCELVASDGCPDASCLDFDGSSPGGTDVFPPDTFVGAIGGHGAADATRLAIGDQGISVGGPAPLLDATCVQPVLRARAPTTDTAEIDVWLEDDASGEKVMWTLEVAGPQWLDHAGTACDLGTFPGDGLVIATPPGGLAAVVDVDRLDLVTRPADDCETPCGVVPISAPTLCGPPPEPNAVPDMNTMSDLDAWSSSGNLEIAVIAEATCDGEGFFRFASPAAAGEGDLRDAVPAPAVEGRCLTASFSARVPDAGSAAVHPVLTVFDGMGSSQRQELPIVDVTATDWALFQRTCRIEGPLEPLTSATMEIEMAFDQGVTLDVDALRMQVVGCPIDAPACTVIE